MNDKEFCSVGNLGILISYEDFSKMMESLKQIDPMRKELDILQQRVSANHGLYLEVLEKIKELNDMI